MQLLKKQEAEIPKIPSDNHQLLLYNKILMIAHNNIGVIIKKLSEMPKDPEKESQALFHFVKSSEYHDKLYRDPNTLKRSETKSYGYINTNLILYPLTEGVYSHFQYYTELPKEPDQKDWPEK